MGCACVPELMRGCRVEQQLLLPVRDETVPFILISPLPIAANPDKAERV